MDLAAIYAEHPEFESMEPSPRKMPAELYARLRGLLNERRQGWRAWADRQLVLALRDATARAPRGEAQSVPAITPRAAGHRRPGRVGNPATATVRVTYCAECGYEPQALALTEALMGQRQAEFASIELVPWVDGSFEVWIGDDRVHAMDRDGGFPEAATIIEALRSRVD
jgi:selenoprotein W-related protein